MADVMAECMSDNVAAVTRAAKVEAFNSWSACRMREISNARSALADGFVPLSCNRKFAEWDSDLSGSTTFLPLRMRSYAATIMAICEVNRMALCTLAS